VNIALLLAVGCAKPPPEAPKELGELGLFLFQHFEDEDTAELAAGLVNLRPFIEDTDFTLDAKDRALTMPKLEGESLGSLSIPDGATIEKQIPIALAGKSSHPLKGQRELAVEPNQVCIESSSTVWARRAFTSDDGCFVNGSCDSMTTETEVRKENFLAKVWYDQYKDYKSIELEDEDGNITEALIARSWTEKKFIGDDPDTSWDQLFQLDITYEKGGESLRWFVMWSSITVAILTDDSYANLVVDGVDEAFVFGDEFLAGNIDSCKLDRNAEKPPRE
jgi:hypothetical protein